jgi:hypothetical protein
MKTIKNAGMRTASANKHRFSIFGSAKEYANTTKAHVIIIDDT